MFPKTPTLIALSNISTIVPFLLCTVLLWWVRKGKQFIILWSFFAVASATEITLHFYSLQSQPNAWIIDIYTPIEYCIVSYILSSWNHKERVSKIMKVSIPLFCTIYLILKVSGIENFQFDTVNYISVPLSFLLLSGFAFSTLSSLSASELSSVLRNYRFWILLSIVVYYSGSTVVFAFSYMKPHNLLVQLFYSHAILNILHNILFTIGVLLAFASKPKERTVKLEEYR